MEKLVYLLWKGHEDLGAFNQRLLGEVRRNLTALGAERLQVNVSDSDDDDVVVIPAPAAILMPIPASDSDDDMAQPASAQPVASDSDDDMAQPASAQPVASDSDSQPPACSLDSDSDSDY